MFTIILMILDIWFIIFIPLSIIRLIRVIIMRISFIRKLRSICNKKRYQIKIHRFPLASVFYKSKKIDLSIIAPDMTYHVKLVASFSSKKVYHFVDKNNYVTYMKTFFMLPMARKVSENIGFVSFHRMPDIEKPYRQAANAKYILLFNPLPNEITYVDENGRREIAGNGTKLQNVYIYNGKGFCSLID